MSKIVVFTTGGTIAMKPDPAGHGVVPAVSGTDLIQAIPHLQEICDLEVKEFSNIPSCQMTPKIMFNLAHEVKKVLEDDDVAGVVITHGTDTVEESAFFLDTVLDSPKPVVFTAAMRDAGAAGTDGPANILSAVRTANSPAARGHGVMVVMDDEIHAARDVTKTHSANTAAFASPWWGPIGYVDNDRIIMRHIPQPRKRFCPDALGDDVYLLKMATGVDASLIDYLVDKKAKGLVVEGFGRGNMPPDVQNRLICAVKKGIPVVVVSRCGAGRPAAEYGYAGGGKISREGGIIFGGDLTGPKARLLLMLALGASLSQQKIAEIFAAEQNR